MTTVKAGYICQSCKADHSDIDVRERTDTEPIENFVFRVGRMCREHHFTHYPACRSGKLDLKLPISQSGIGKSGPAITEEEREDIRTQLRRDGR